MSTFPLGLGNRLECWGHRGAFSWNRGNITECVFTWKADYGKTPTMSFKSSLSKNECESYKAHIQRQSLWRSGSPCVAGPCSRAFASKQNWEAKSAKFGTHADDANKSKSSVAFRCEMVWSEMAAVASAAGKFLHVRFRLEQKLLWHLNVLWSVQISLVHLVKQIRTWSKPHEANNDT